MGALRGGWRGYDLFDGVAMAYGKQREVTLIYDVEIRSMTSVDMYKV